MHCPGHFIGRIITATGVTPDIVLANFLILCHKQFSRFRLMATNREIFDQIAPGWYNFRHWSIFRKELEARAKRCQKG